MDNLLNKIHKAGSLNFLRKIKDNSIDLIVTSPPYWNAVEYEKNKNYTYEKYLEFLLKIWIECERILKPNSKLVINTPILPVPQKILRQDTRHIKNINNDIEKTILENTKFNLFSLFIWQKQTSKLMFGSYPYPGNLLENNTIEYINVYVKPGKSKKYQEYVKQHNKIRQKEWIDLIQQVWFIYPQDIKRLKNHPAPFPEKLPARIIKLYTYGAISSFEGDIVLDPFVGTGTTCVVAKKMGRLFIGIDNIDSYVKYAKRRLYKAKQGEKVNYLIGKAKYPSQDDLSLLMRKIEKSRIFVIDGEEKKKLDKKNKQRTFGRKIINIQGKQKKLF